MGHRVFVVLLVGAMLAFGVAGGVMVMRMRSRALAQAQAAPKPVPRFEKTGGMIVELEAEGAADQVEKTARLAASALRQRLDPDDVRGVEAFADGKSIEVRVPVPGGLSSDGVQWIKEFAALGAAGLWDEAQRVSLLAGSPSRPASELAKGAIEAVAGAHPDQAAAVHALVEAAGRLNATGGVGDPISVVELAVRPGVLEFRIAGDSDGAAASKPDFLVWRPIHRPEAWVHGGLPKPNPSEDAAFNADPAAFLKTRGYRAVVREGSVFLLVGNTAEDSLTSAQPGWSVQEVQGSRDQMGRPAVMFRLNSTGGQLMETMTGHNVQRHLAVIVDGEVYTAPRLMTAIGGACVIEGPLDAREFGVLFDTVKNPLPGQVRLVGVREERR